MEESMGHEANEALLLDEVVRYAQEERAEATAREFNRRQQELLARGIWRDKHGHTTKMDSMDGARLAGLETWLMGPKCNLALDTKLHCLAAVRHELVVRRLVPPGPVNIKY